jgi:hypothetical protein
LRQTLEDPEKSKQLEQCIENNRDDLDRWHCIFKTIGAEDIWEKYKDVWEKVEEKGEGLGENE